MTQNRPCAQIMTAPVAHVPFVRLAQTGCDGICSDQNGRPWARRNPARSPNRRNPGRWLDGFVKALGLVLKQRPIRGHGADGECATSTEPGARNRLVSPLLSSDIPKPQRIMAWQLYRGAAATAMATWERRGAIQPPDASLWITALRPPGQVRKAALPPDARLVHPSRDD